MYLNNKQIRNLLENKFRFSNRRINEKRPISILKNKNNLELNLGKTKIFCKIFKDIVEPSKEKPNEGIINFKINLSARNDRNKDKTNEDLNNHISKILERGIKNSKAIDIESLVILNGKYVWKILVELTLLNDDGNIIDAMFYSSIISLKLFKKNFIGFENGNIKVYNENEKNFQKLSINFFPITITYGIVNYFDEENEYEENIIIEDPDLEEEKILDSLISITVNEFQEVCNIIQPGKKPISVEILKELINKSINNENIFKNLMDFCNKEELENSFEIYKVLNFK